MAPQSARTVDPIDALLEAPRARAHIAKAVARSNAVAAKRAARPVIAPSERARRRALNITRKRRIVALRSWMMSTGLPADEFIVARFDAGVTQRGLRREFLDYAATHYPDVSLGTWTFNVLAFRQLHGAPASPARTRVQAAAKARGDAYRRPRATPPSTTEAPAATEAA